METPDTRMHALQLATSISRRTWFKSMRERVSTLCLPPQAMYVGFLPARVVWETSVNGARFIVVKYLDFPSGVKMNRQWWIAKSHPGCFFRLDYEWINTQGHWTHNTLDWTSYLPQARWVA